MTQLSPVASPEASLALLSTKGLVLGFDGNTILNGISCDFYPASLVSIVGPNGAGKTSFFNLLSGHLQPDAGAVFLQQNNITKASVPQRVQMGLGRSFQINQLFNGLSVFENIYLSVAARHHKGHVFWRRASAEQQINASTWQYIQQSKLTKIAHTKVADLSHGEQRKLELALLLALEARVWLLDEPTAGLGVDEVPEILALIEQAKQGQDKLILLIEHKLEAVKQLSDRILVLNHGKIIADDNPAAVMANPAVQQAYFGGQSL